MAHNKCLKYSLFWAATATAPVSTCNLDAIITSVDDEDITTPVVTPCTEGYGLLYNWYTLNDTRNIAASNWRVFVYNDYLELFTYLSNGFDGGKLKETGYTYWDAPNTDATNELNFNAKGTGYRSGIDGQFFLLKEWFPLTSLNFEESENKPYTFELNNIDGQLQISNVELKDGVPIRLRKESTTLSNGQTGTYTGNDGKTYRTICINGVEYLADNLRETKFRNGDIIPWYGANQEDFFTDVEWAALTTAGVCAYNNDVANVGCAFSFEPTVIVVPEPEENCDIFVPQGFSPSNQDGINDYFRVQNLDCYPIHKMSIYDRNGNLLYTRTNNYNTEPWDGKVGGTVISGVTRTWILEINGAIHSTGSVYVI